jgi:hypothetical protein
MLTFMQSSLLRGGQVPFSKGVSNSFTGRAYKAPVELCKALSAKAGELLIL